MSDDDVKGRLVLIDGSSLAFRAYFALPETIATREGFPTNALYGFSQMLLKIVGEFAPAALVVAWDAREKTFRHEEYEGYKAQRPHMPEPLSQQWPHFPELAAAFGAANLVKPGFEADDILGTLTAEAERQGVRSLVVTGDRDALQVVDEDVWVLTTGRGVTDVKVYTPAAVVERYGVTPAQVPDFIGLKGDSSDNIPGVPGVGEKTAAALIQQFGSIEALYEHLDEVGSEKRRAALAEHEPAARLSKRLATMVRDVPLEEDVVGLVAGTAYELPVAAVEEIFRRYEFARLARRVSEMGSGGGGAGGAPAAAWPRLVVGESAETVIALLGRKECALAVAPPEEGDDRVVAVYDGGDAVVAARLSPESWPAVWRLAGHVVGHDVKSLPGCAAATAAPAWDTAVAAYLLAPERPGGDLFRLAGYDGGQLMEGPQGEAEAATRAVVTWRLREEQEPRLESLELERLLWEIELPLIGVLARMEAAGVAVDLHRLGEITARLRDSVDECRDRIWELAGGEFTIGSPQQLASVLFERLGLPPARRGKTGFSTDARVLRTLREKHPVVPLVEEWRELTKLLNTYLDALPAYVSPDDGRLHTTFNQTVTSTGRLSSSDPNLQNIPVRSELGSRIRECFVAAEGMRLVVADYSQIELRLMAHLAQEPALLDAYRRGEDVHRVTAAAVAGVRPEEVTKEQREHAKATNFGIMYGLSAYGLSEQVEIPVEEARAFIEAYFARYPRVKEFRERTIAEAAERGYVTTIFGRRRSVPELRSANQRERALGERLAVNTVLQGSAADIIKVAMVGLDRELAAGGPNARLVLQVHDELVVECPAGEVAAVIPLVREAMCGAFVMEPPLEVAIGVGENWLAAK